MPDAPERYAAFYEHYARVDQNKHQDFPLIPTNYEYSFIVSIEDLRATDYNPHFYWREIQQMKNKDLILLDILNQHETDSIKITDVRDELLNRCSDENLHPADTRRWINGKFSTLVNKGVLTRKKLPNSKKHTFEKTPYFEEYITTHSLVLPKFRAVLPTSEIVANKNNNLDVELESYRQTMLSQLGEIEEYRRIREEYPELGEAAAKEFKQAVDDNYRMLGRMRAIEKLIEKTSPPTKTSSPTRL